MAPLNPRRVVGTLLLATAIIIPCLFLLKSHAYGADECKTSLAYVIEVSEQRKATGNGDHKLYSGHDATLFVNAVNAVPPGSNYSASFVHVYTFSRPVMIKGLGLAPPGGAIVALFNEHKCLTDWGTFTKARITYILKVAFGIPL